MQRRVEPRLIGADGWARRMLRMLDGEHDVDDDHAEHERELVVHPGGDANQAAPCCQANQTPKTMVNEAPGTATSQLRRPSMKVSRGRAVGSSFEW